MIRPSGARGTVALALAALALSACGAETNSSAEAPSAQEFDQISGQESAEATAAGHWLAGQLDKGLLSYRSEYGPFTDYGMSIDAALGLDRVGGHDEDVEAIADAVADAVSSYTEFPSGKGTHVSAGATAKALVLSQVAGTDPTAFGGTDLVSGLEALVADSSRIADSFPSSNKQDADYANVIGQVYAARGLVESESAEAEPVLEFLLDQQCTDGWFRLTFTADPAAADQSCDADAQAAPDADTTALAVIHLSALADRDDDTEAAIDDAVAWLAAQQEDDGSVAGGQPASANANTTGLAGWAFGESGDGEAAARAADWLAGLQLESGAVAFDSRSFDQASDGQISAKTRSQWLLATAQAAPALLWYAG